MLVWSFAILVVSALTWLFAVLGGGGASADGVGVVHYILGGVVRGVRRWRCQRRWRGHHPGRSGDIRLAPASNATREREEEAAGTPPSNATREREEGAAGTSSSTATREREEGAAGTSSSNAIRNREEDAAGTYSSNPRREPEEDAAGTSSSNATDG